jgi:hypothetical protein
MRIGEALMLALIAALGAVACVLVVSDAAEARLPWGAAAATVVFVVAACATIVAVLLPGPSRQQH